MIVDRRRSLRISMGNYGERVESSARYSAHHHDLGYTDEEWREHVNEVGILKATEELEDLVMGLIRRALEPEVQEALDLRDPEEPSFIETAYDIQQEQQQTKKVKRSK